jgi:hypothetical protein
VRGARVLSVHDVAETVDVLKVWQAVEQAGQETAAIGLGANLGDARDALAWAKQQLAAYPDLSSAPCDS